MSRQVAGSLSYDAIGKNAEVTYTHGNIESTVRDVIEKVSHEKEGVRLFFKGTRWTPNAIAVALGGPVDSGLLVPPNLTVTLKDD